MSSLEGESQGNRAHCLYQRYLAFAALFPFFFIFVPEGIMEGMSRRWRYGGGIRFLLYYDTS